MLLNVYFVCLFLYTLWIGTLSAMAAIAWNSKPQLQPEQGIYPLVMTVAVRDIEATAQSK